MKNALVLYHSLYGNTKLVAMSLARGLEEVGIETDCMSITEIGLVQIPSYNFLALGSPTHIIRPSKDMKMFLQSLKSLKLEGLSGFAFDTRILSRMNSRKWLLLENSAARSIESALKKSKIRILAPRESAIVEGREGPLDNGVKERFMELGRELGRALTRGTIAQKINE
ncbi:MAG: flavodoxin family protein [Candidatus Thorarchaeota archaeon]|jgi:flavorubredoxin